MSHCHVWLKHVITFAIWFFTSLLTFKLLCFTYSSTYKYVHACNCGSNKTALIWSVNFIATCYCELWHYFYYPRMVLRSVASVCLSVCSAVTFESLDLESSFFGTQLHLQNLQVKIVYQGHRSRSQEQKTCLCIVFAGGLPSIENQTCCFLSAFDKKQQAWSGWDICPHRFPVRTL